MIDLFEIQPAQCRQPLPVMEQLPYEASWKDEPDPTGRIKRRIEVLRRVLFFDPSEVFERIRFKGNPYQRFQCNYKINHKVYVEDLFPKRTDKLCACGCGEKLTGKKYRWATEACSDFAIGVYWVIYGRAEDIRPMLHAYYTSACISCGEINAGWEMDHIIPVHVGGGCCWLSNYQMLCNPCHKAKTKADRKLY